MTVIIPLSNEKKVIKIQKQVYYVIMNIFFFLHKKLCLTKKYKDYKKVKKISGLSLLNNFIYLKMIKYFILPINAYSSSESESILITLLSVD